MQSSHTYTEPASLDMTRHLGERNLQAKSRGKLAKKRLRGRSWIGLNKEITERERQTDRQTMDTV